MEKEAAKDPERTGFGSVDVITAKAASEENLADTYSGVVQVMEEVGHDGGKRRCSI